MKTAAKNNHHHCDGRLLFLSDAFHRRNHQSCLPRGEEEKKKISSSSFPILTAFGAFDEEKNENEIGDDSYAQTLYFWMVWMEQYIDAFSKSRFFPYGTLDLDSRRNSETCDTGTGTSTISTYRIAKHVERENSK